MKQCFHGSHISHRRFPANRLFKCCKSDSTITQADAPTTTKEVAPASDAITEAASEEKVEEKPVEAAPVEEEPKEEEPKEEEETAAPVEEEPKEEETVVPEENDEEAAEKEAVEKGYKCCGVY